MPIKVAYTVPLIIRKLLKEKNSYLNSSKSSKLKYFAFKINTVIASLQIEALYEGNYTINPTICK